MRYRLHGVTVTSELALPGVRKIARRPTRSQSRLPALRRRIADRRVPSLAPEGNAAKSSVALDRAMLRAAICCGSRIWPTSTCLPAAIESCAGHVRDWPPRRSSTCCSIRCFRLRSAGEVSSFCTRARSTSPVSAAVAFVGSTGSGKSTLAAALGAGRLPGHHRRLPGDRRRCAAARRFLVIPDCGCGATPLEAWRSNGTRTVRWRTTRQSGGSSETRFAFDRRTSPPGGGLRVRPAPDPAARRAPIR